MTEPAIDAIAAHIAANDLAFKTAQVVRDRHYADALAAIEVVRAFIRERKYILYGGTAVDYALRLRGTHLYDDDDFPDFDFWSPTHIDTACELFSLIASRCNACAGASTSCPVRLVKAVFPHTMRIGVGDNIWVADISYIPPELYERIPTMMYDGMRFVHPHQQFVDMHNSLAFPYDNAPNEVAPARWQKDVKRFNLLSEHYPIEVPAVLPQAHEVPALREVRVPMRMATQCAFAGFAGLALILAQLDAPQRASLPRLIKEKCSNRELVFSVPHGIIEYFAPRSVLAAAHAQLRARSYCALLNLTYPCTCACAASASDATYVEYGCEYMLVACAELTVVHARAVSVQQLLRHFVASYMRLHHLRAPFPYDAPDANYYAQLYRATLDLIEEYQQMDIMLPQTDVIGANNISYATAVDMYKQCARILQQSRARCAYADPNSAQYIAPPLLIPRRITLDEACDPNRAPFAYEKCAILKISGEEV